MPRQIGKYDYISPTDPSEDYEYTNFKTLRPHEAGALFGGAVASVAGGPLGLLVGLGAGILSKRLKATQAEKERRDAHAIAAEDDASRNTIENMIKDPSTPDDVRQQLYYARRQQNAGYEQMMNGNQTEGRKMWDDANNVMKGILTANTQARIAEQAANHQMERGLIQSSAEGMRTEFQTANKNWSEIDGRLKSALNVVNQKGFDPNSPFNKAMITDLMQVGVGGLYKDSPDALQALAMAVPYVGVALSDALKAKEYKLTKEDYNRFLLEMTKRNDLVTENTNARLGEQARNLDGFAKRTGHMAPDESLGDYVTGGQTEIRFTPTPPILQTAPTVPTTEAEKKAADASEHLKTAAEEGKNIVVRGYEGAIDATSRAMEGTSNFWSEAQKAHQLDIEDQRRRLKEKREKQRQQLPTN